MKKALPVALGASVVVLTGLYTGSSLLSPSDLSDSRTGYGTKRDGTSYVTSAANVDQTPLDRLLTYNLDREPLQGYDALFIGKRSPMSEGVDYREALARGSFPIPLDFVSGNAVLLVTPDTERKLINDPIFSRRFYKIFSSGLPRTVLTDPEEIRALTHAEGFPVDRYLDNMPLRYD